MIAKIFKDYRAGTITSIFSASASEAASVMPPTIEMQWIQAVAAVVAIVAGLVAIVNGCDTFIRRHRKISTNEKDN